VFSNIKGWFGEKETQIALWMKLDSEIYKRFHNLIVPTQNGTTQIDHVLLSKYGIFVIETKNYEGWIFGNEHQKMWTQVLYGKKSQFQNPLHQNFKHTKALIEHLRVDADKLHSVVFFIGDATIKTNVPSNVMTSGLSAHIKQFTNVMFSDSELTRLGQELSQMNATLSSTREHVAGLKERFSNNTTCPKCGKPLVKRTTKQGPKAGTEFLGCSNFPTCRYVRN
jgi:restriction system protein